MVEDSKGSPPQFVLPGETLATSEEFVPGRNVSEEDGELISLVCGTIRKDDDNLEISVDSRKKKIIPRVGDTVFGQVIKGDRGRYTVAVGALVVDHNSLFELNVQGNLRVFSDRNSPDQRSPPPVRVGDYVRAKVFRTGMSLELSLRGNEFGTVIAFCSRCRTRLVKKNNSLICTNCDNEEIRKMPSDYGDIIIGGK
ncbi:MAG: exosome complex RNA-binding protein Csl4 [Candidatus Thermoplasmatota archaeon]|nr:exosome complex RNA-binding protein Csl4 [Candidatus Thermoplasmatota archaeon]MCL5785680.1 exosome complex RNA-binding protein Csl4 [Candidatus Thermoplasmatota archaeon]